MEKYEFLSRTGEGAYGSVWRARDKNTGLQVAVKKMKEVPTTEEESEIAMREVRVLQLAKHVGIVNLLEAYKSQSGRLYLVFEYVERTLLQELKANRSGMPPAAVKSVTWQLLQALSYLHRKQIIHRDIKPSNILITDGGVVKICDFGFARACVNSTADPAYTTYVVTRWYRPPEVLVGDTYGPPVDVWALGCIFAEMLSGRPLFPGRNHHDQLWLILKCLGTMTERQLELLDSDPQFACFRLPTTSEIEPLEHRLANIPPSAMQLLRACLHPDPKQRASADELLAMPYFHGVADVLPLDDLLAYPDAEMRARLDRLVADSHATSAPVASPPPINGKRPLAPANKQQQSTAPAAGSTSPTRLASQQGGPPPPSKAVTVPKLDPCVEAARPPLLRHITAPAGGFAGKLQPQLPLQPLAEHAQQHPHHQHQRSRTSSDGSQQSSPQAPLHGCPVPQLGAVVVPRGRLWQASGDGSGDAVGPFVRQLSGTVNMPPQGHPQLPTAPGGGASEHSALASRSQRNTWNGTAGPRISVTGSSAGKCGGHGAYGGQGGQPSSLNSSLTNTGNNAASALAHDNAAVQRKAHSLAGNEALQVPGNVPSGARGLSVLGVVQGRSLAPPAGPGTVEFGGSGNGSAGLQLPPPQFGFSGASRGQSLAPSPPPHAYGGALRGTNSVPIAALSALPPRISSDGTTGAAGMHTQQQQLAVYPSAFSGKPPPGPGAPGLHGSGPIPTGALDSEASDGSEADTSADQNDGRRASDTVLYAAAALKEAKNRLDKASHIISGTARQQSGGLEGPSNSSGSGGGSAAQGLAALRAPSFNRISGPTTTGPPSPDNAVLPSLPPLHQTPRRMSAPETAITSQLHSSALLPSTGSGGTAGGRQAAVAMPQAPAATASGYLQRHNAKQYPAQGQHQHPHAAPGHGTGNGNYAPLPSGVDADGADGVTTAHVTLPALDVGPGKGARLPSGTVPGIGVGVVRRPSKGSIRLTPTDTLSCKREEPAALEAVPE